MDAVLFCYGGATAAGGYGPRFFFLNHTDGSILTGSKIEFSPSSADFNSYRSCDYDAHSHEILFTMPKTTPT